MAQLSEPTMFHEIANPLLVEFLYAGRHRTYQSFFMKQTAVRILTQLEPGKYPKVR